MVIEKNSIPTSINLSSFYENAANVQFSRSESLITLLANYHTKLSETTLSQGKIYIFTSNLSIELLESLSEKVCCGYAAYIFLCLQKNFRSKIRKFLTTHLSF